MSLYSCKKPTFTDAQKLSSFYKTVESKIILYNELISILGEEYIETISTKNVHEIYNNILLKYYPNEASIKASFINNVLMKDSNQVTIFELPIINSRADLCKINGESIVYEIKTELDNFSRLPKQLTDYEKIFDKIYVITHRDKIIHIKEQISDKIGIYSYRITKNGRYIYKMERSAARNNNLNSREQLNVLRKSELSTLVTDPNIPSREELITNILQCKSNYEINNIFKQILKSRYEKQWTFLKNNKLKILEIDYQWFYKNSVNPDLIYN